MSLLPQRIIPQAIPLGKVQPDGTVIIETNWWLLLYNLCAQILGAGTTASGLPSSAIQEIAAADADAADTDATALRLPISALANLIPTDADPAPSLADVRNALLLANDVFLPDAASADARNALIFAQDLLPQDTVAAAQPAATVVVGGSPFTYTAPFSGCIAITAGTVSLLQIVRQGVTVATGLTTGVIPLSRGDQLVITHTGAPTAVFLPT